MFAPGALAEWAWPAFGETGERVPPDALEEYRRKHHFKAPCCLCAIVEEEYTEATIGVVESLPMPHADPDRNRPIMHGEYVASCAKGECGYFVCLERFYTLNGIKVRVYNERDTPLVAEEGRMGAEIQNSVRNGEGLYQVMPDIMRRGSSARLRTENLSVALEKRGSLLSDFMLGVPEGRFWFLFVQCHLCKAVMLREPFSTFHQCVRFQGRYVNSSAWLPGMRRFGPGPEPGIVIARQELDYITRQAEEPYARERQIARERRAREYQDIEVDLERDQGDLDTDTEIEETQAPWERASPESPAPGRDSSPVAERASSTEPLTIVELMNDVWGDAAPTNN
ncbi:hypothetical protein DFP72DRAFT_1066854 [Ephemerocybe angulata]|uniref:Uncharacterized protein n=1 Tax=Ephemerocybe angulata TaxID=980116 RepID=A0A8H6I237_9AGAR|nr:hypothetical protein DFP72DRAFT_1066854 [Tulosesus angulatus]